MQRRKYDLEDRLVKFVVDVKNISDDFPNTPFGNNLAGQIVRSSASTAQNYAESMSAESTRDFIHKPKILLKELRECRVTLKIIYTSGDLRKSKEKYLDLLQENDELIAIFVKSIQTTE